MTTRVRFEKAVQNAETAVEEMFCASAFYAEQDLFDAVCAAHDAMERVRELLNNQTETPK